MTKGKGRNVFASVLRPSSSRPDEKSSNTFFDLSCLIEGDRSVFDVTVSKSSKITALKKLVHNERKNGLLCNIDTADLVLLKVNIDPETSDEDDLAKLSFTPDDEGIHKLKEWNLVSDYWSEQPEARRVHVFVKAPAPGKRKRELPGNTMLVHDPHSTVADISSTLLQRWAKPISHFPDLGNLAAYIVGPLAEEDKIPISNDLMRELASFQTDPKSMCNLDEIQELFRSSEEESATIIWTVVNPGLTFSPPDNDSTENAFISFWDRNIRQLFDIAITARTIRDSNKNTSTALLRPDFGVLIDGICAFRGEEKAPRYSGTHPKAELLDKLTWTYDPAPYVLGYHAIGSVVTLAAISPSSVADLVSTDLSWRSKRIQGFMRVIKVCSVITALRDVIGSRNTMELIPIIREGTGIIIKVGSSAVEKKYTKNGVERVQHLQMIYQLLQDKDVPSVDHLIQSYIDEYHGAVVYLKPKGVDDSPRRTQEVLDAVKCILQALTVMHPEPNPLFHRDIRWPNIIRDASNYRKWFLIDWDDAAMPPTRAAMHLNPDNHSPRVFQDNHGAEVDIWAIGKLIVDGVKFSSIHPQMMNVGKMMMTGEIVTAAQALENLPNL